ncbi:hypothetical protein H0H81_000837 [Sphagnurus paluster]|uniref:Mitochondrial import inner membrane translocase subunit TIM50 n=1 Tax=Sphagnurus paluster TaxID=117069 RepID=A0A9P7KIU0_9AGAR|nr:hypothetical protein H0H81_000837 [Sphagnurus paluster]
MAAPAASLPGVSSEVILKNTSSTPEPELMASEPLRDDAPSPAAPAMNGTTDQRPGAHKDIVNDLVNHSTPQFSSDSAAGSVAQGPTSSLPAGTDPGPALDPSELEPREQGQKYKDGDKSGPSSSPSATRSSSPAQSTQKTIALVHKTNGTSAHGPTVPRSPKPTFLSKLLRALIPCVYPSPDTHPIEIHEVPSVPTSKEKPSSSSAEGVQSNFDSSVKEVALGPTTEAAALTPSDPVISPEFQPVEVEDIVPKTPPSPPHILPIEETEGVTSGAVQAPVSTGGSPTAETKRHSRDSTPPSNASAEEESEGTSYTDEDVDGLDEDDEERLIYNGGAGIPIGPSIQQADYVVPVEIEYHLHNVYVIKRPGVDKFLKMMGEIYEVVVFTASLSKVSLAFGSFFIQPLTEQLEYADPVLDKLDIHQVVTHRLFRESCYNHRGNYVKDLSQLGRPIADTIILDNSPASYIFHPNNAVPVSSWFNDPHDTELTDLIPFLTDLANVDDVRGVLDGAR